jgi:diguanylate cyclase (GGDEF)-like protein
VIEFERRVHEQAGIDAETGLLDRLALQLTLQRRLQSGEAATTALAVIDIDAFQRIARCYGEKAAATLNHHIACHLERAVTEDEILAAIGRNRFALNFTAASLETASQRLSQLTAGLAEQEFAAGSDKLRFTASAGITLLRNKERPEQSLERAERALELAKASGRNTTATSDDVDDEVEAWAESAAAGRLFETTLARDVMIPCPLLLPAEESLDQAHAQLVQTQLIHAPVVDADGRLLGIAALDEIESKRPRGGKLRSSSIRLLRHVMATDVPTFEETASLGTLMEFFTADGHELAVIVRDKKPLGIVTCQGLAALNERLEVDRFVPCGVASASSEYLVVPDMPKLETE